MSVNVSHERTVRCPICERDGEPSTVREHTAIAMPVLRTFRDERGRVHAHQPEPVRTSYECSRGHNFELEEMMACPTCGWRNPA